MQQAWRSSDESIEKAAVSAFTSDLVVHSSIAVFKILSLFTQCRLHSVGQKQDLYIGFKLLQEADAAITFKSNS